MLFEGQEFETKKGDTKELTPELREQLIGEAEKILQEYVEERRKKVREEFEGKVPEEELKLRILQEEGYVRESPLLFGSSILDAQERMGTNLSVEQRASIVQELSDRRYKKSKEDENRKSKESLLGESEITEERED